MSKQIKEMVRSELASRYAEARSACVVDLTGLSVQSTERLRRTLREKSARVQVVKNSMARGRSRAPHWNPWATPSRGLARW
jgi:ribosomal protein L10